MQSILDIGRKGDDVVRGNRLRAIALAVLLRMLAELLALAGLVSVNVVNGRKVWGAFKGWIALHPMAPERPSRSIRLWATTIPPEPRDRPSGRCARRRGHATAGAA